MAAAEGGWRGGQYKHMEHVFIFEGKQTVCWGYGI